MEAEVARAHYRPKWITTDGTHGMGEAMDAAARPRVPGVGFGRRSFLCDVARKLQRAAQGLCYSIGT
jgi:hypothetical protein